jgi:hypothetical protein
VTALGENLVTPIAAYYMHSVAKCINAHTP